MAPTGDTVAAGSSKNLLHRYVPITAWLPRYQRAWLRTDLLAGLAVWSLTVPQAMAYSSIAGVPPVFGLFSVPLAVIAYAMQEPVILMRIKMLQHMSMKAAVHFKKLVDPSFMTA